MIGQLKPGITTYQTPGDTRIVITRVVNAPARVAFEAWTRPEHIRRWLLGPDGWTMTVCEIDPTPGSAWRYTWRKGDGSEMTLSGLIREFTPPLRLVTTERWGPEWPETVNEVDFDEQGGQTTITLTINYPSKEARDAALGTGMKEGLDAGFARLDLLVGSLT